MVDRLLGEIKGFFDLLFPPACPLCHCTLQPGTTLPFCPSCSAEINPLPAGCCSRCALPFSAENSSAHLCEPCSRSLPPYLSVHSVGIYDAGLRKAVHHFKYEGGHYLDRDLGALLGHELEDIPAPDLIVPVPLHASRLRERTYNQSILLAHELGKQISRPVVTTLLSRVRNTPQQQGLRAKERTKNLRGAFACHQSVRGKHVLLVDDVMTTGATATACSQALLDSGAAEVRVAVVGRAGRG